MYDSKRNSSRSARCYAWGYYAAAMRKEIDPVLSQKQIDKWLRTRLTPEELASVKIHHLVGEIYKCLKELSQ